MAEWLPDDPGSVAKAALPEANARDAEMHLLTQTYGNGIVTTQLFDPNTGAVKQLRAGVPKVRCTRAPNRKHLWCGVKTSRRVTTFVVTSTNKVLQVVFAQRGD